MHAPVRTRSSTPSHTPPRTPLFCESLTQTHRSTEPAQSPNPQNTPHLITITQQPPWAPHPPPPIHQAVLHNPQGREGMHSGTPQPQTPPTHLPLAAHTRWDAKDPHRVQMRKTLPRCVQTCSRPPTQHPSRPCFPPREQTHTCVNTHATTVCQHTVHPLVAITVSTHTMPNQHFYSLYTHTCTHTRRPRPYSFANVPFAHTATQSFTRGTWRREGAALTCVTWSDASHVTCLTCHMHHMPHMGHMPHASTCLQEPPSQPPSAQDNTDQRPSSQHDTQRQRHIVSRCCSRTPRCSASSSYTRVQTVVFAASQAAAAQHSTQQQLAAGSTAATDSRQLPR
jgi:hypothetical protein